MRNKNKPILCRLTMPLDYRTKEQWDMFVKAREIDITELEEVIKVAYTKRKQLIRQGKLDE